MHLGCEPPQMTQGCSIDYRENPRISGHRQYKPMLSKGQLYMSFLPGQNFLSVPPTQTEKKKLSEKTGISLIQTELYLAFSQTEDTQHI